MTCPAQAFEDLPKEQHVTSERRRVAFMKTHEKQACCPAFTRMCWRRHPPAASLIVCGCDQFLEVKTSAVVLRVTIFGFRFWMDTRTLPRGGAWCSLGEGAKQVGGVGCLRC